MTFTNYRLQEQLNQMEYQWCGSRQQKSRGSAKRTFNVI